MAQEQWTGALQHAVDFYEASKFAKLRRSPARLLVSRFAAWRCRRSGATLRARARLFTGDKLNVVLPDPVSLALYMYGVYEPELSAAILSLVREGDVAVDVGAHVGYYATLMSRLVGASGVVHAFEPTPSTFALLEQNVRPLGNVRAQYAAAWNADTMLELADFGAHMSTFNSVTHARVEGATAAPKRHKVLAVRLDNYLRVHGGRVDFVKVDVENAEREVLEGLGTLLDQQRPIVTIEVGDLGESSAGRSRALLESIRRREYLLFDAGERGQLRDHEVRDSYTYGNVVALPLERIEFRNQIPLVLAREASRAAHSSVD